MLCSCICALFKYFAYISVLLVTIKMYLVSTEKWCRSQTCLLGKTAIVTGANAGIGYETALDFAKRGARVILACRNKDKAEEAREKIIKATGNENVAVRVIDLSSLKSVRSFAREINESEGRLDILVNNAGAGGIREKMTEDGLPILMQVNYFSSFLLTHLLIDLLIKSGPSRVVNVSSLFAHYAIGFGLNKIDKTAKNSMIAYAYSKVCQILFTQESALRWRQFGITTYSVHPGVVKTEIFRHFEGNTKQINDFFYNLFYKTSEAGAQTTIYCATQQGIENLSGEHFADCQRVSPYRYTKNADGVAKELWDKSIELVKLEPDEISITRGSIQVL